MSRIVKTFVICVLAAAMLAAALPFQAYADEFKRGDVNGDGEIDVEDIVDIRDHVLGKNFLSGINVDAANTEINYETGKKTPKIDVGDIVMVRDFILGKGDIPVGTVDDAPVNIGSGWSDFVAV